MNLTPTEISAIADAVAEGLEQRRRIKSDVHEDHHDFVAVLIEERDERRQLWIEMRSHLAKWGMAGVLTALGTAVWFWLKHSLQG